MARTYAPLLAFAFLVAAVSLLLAVAPSAGQEAEVPEGQAFFLEHKCSMCHGVPAAGIEAKTKSAAMKGSDLGGKVEVDFEELAAFLRKEAPRGDVEHKKAFKGTDEELQAIVDWLGTLEAPE